MFAVAKIVRFLSEPLSLVLTLLVFGSLFWLLRLRWPTRLTLGCGVALFLVIALTPVAEWGAWRLENRFPRTDVDLSSLDGAIVLGGATDSGVLAETRGTYVINDAAERLTTAVALRRRAPDLPIVISGFSGALRHEGLSEGEITRLLLADLGVPAEAFLFEEESRNTHENAVRTRALLGDIDGRWLLVTSATHMPRSVGVFRQAGYDVVPHTVDFRVTAPWLPWSTDIVPYRFALARLAAREYVGLVSYRLLGRTNALFPAPGEVIVSEAR